MRVIILKELRYYTMFKALEEGSVITSSGDHPGPDDITLHIKEGERFTLPTDWIAKNDFEVIQSSSDSQTSEVKQT